MLRLEIISPRPLHATPTTNSKWVLRKKELGRARRSHLAIVIISLGCHLYFLPRRTRQRAEGFLNAFFLECCWSLDQGVDLSRSQIRVYSTLVSHSRHAMRKWCKPLARRRGHAVIVVVVLHTFINLASNKMFRTRGKRRARACRRSLCLFAGSVGDKSAID